MHPSILLVRIIVLPRIKAMIFPRLIVSSLFRKAKRTAAAASSTASSATSSTASSPTS